MELLPETERLKWIMKTLVGVAKKSTCKRSKCGSLIISKREIVIGEGYNSMPLNDQKECFKDFLSPTFKSDKTCCIHAEQRAIMNALSSNISLKDSRLYFIRLDENDQPLHAGKPYCTICSKMALDAGIGKFILWHKEGWASYDTKYYNELSFKYHE